jgi:hypothetical protein
MSAKTSTFAGQLRHFARSVDIVDDEIFDRVRTLIVRYVRTELDAEYFSLMREESLGGEPVLKMFWSSDDREHSAAVRTREGGYSNPLTQAFATDRALWIVGADKKPIRDSTELVDEWSHCDTLPPYQPSSDQPIRTAVILPLRRRRVLGVYYFESCSPLGITDVAKVELAMLAEALAILLELYDVNRSQSRMTASAIADLQDNLESARFPRLAKPHFFVASSVRGDRKVMTVVSEVLDEFSDRIEFTDWRRMTQSGNISTQIAKEITRSRFGICYLSEPGPDGGTYVDNPNVVFEAGMLHARTANNESGDGGEPTGWIPIREVDSPPAPFDFASERTVQVPRRADGAVNEDRLRDELRARVQVLLGEG